MRGGKSTLLRRGNHNENSYEVKNKPISKKAEIFDKELDSDTEDIFEESKTAITTVTSSSKPDTELQTKYEQARLQIEYLQNLVTKLTQIQNDNIITKLEKFEQFVLSVQDSNLVERIEKIESHFLKEENKEGEEIIVKPTILNSSKIPLPGNKIKK